MTFSRTEVTQIGRATGFRVEMVEKVLWLLRLLEQFNKHPFLKNKWALKGGTAFMLAESGGSVMKAVLVNLVISS